MQQQQAGHVELECQAEAWARQRAQREQSGEKVRCGGRQSIKKEVPYGERRSRKPDARAEEEEEVVYAEPTLPKPGDDGPLGDHSGNGRGGIKKSTEGGELSCKGGHLPALALSVHSVQQLVEVVAGGTNGSSDTIWRRAWRRQGI
jgi:hypothetical protein